MCSLQKHFIAVVYPSERKKSASEINFRCIKMFTLGINCPSVLSNTHIY